MASNGYYLLFIPEKARVYDLFTILFSSKSLADYDFIETNYRDLPPLNITSRLLIFIFLIFSLISSLSSFCKTWNKGQTWFEYSLNKVHLNGGILGLLWHTLTGSVIKPDAVAANYRSIKSFQSGEVEMPKKLISLVKLELNLDEIDTSPQDASSSSSSPLLSLSLSLSSISVMELAALASILAYENEERIKDTVDNQWQMSFVEFFECWNMNINAYETEAFICCDKQEDPSLIIVAFRGTSELNDWICDFNLSLIQMSDMGMVHLGFMTALGLDTDKACSGDDRNIDKGFPKDYSGDKPLAYYSITKKVKKLVEEHKNAKILITGHSLGGALAILYVSLLVMLGEDDLVGKISRVITFGQPRVGDSDFGDTMLKIVGKKYMRLVYRYDIVPRIPFELPFVFKFHHFGACINYDGWYYGQMVQTLPNMNYFNVLYGVVMFWDAVVDLARAIWEIKDGVWEGITAIFFRFLWIVCPGVGFHNTRDYLNGVRMAKIGK